MKKLNDFTLIVTVKNNQKLPQIPINNLIMAINFMKTYILKNVKNTKKK